MNKVIIAGGRDYIPRKDVDELFLNTMREIWIISEVVCGGAHGADEFGKYWALKNGITVKMFRPNWDLYGKRAGFLRNRDMGEYADAAILFPGGKGTENMRKIMEQLGKNYMSVDHGF